LWCRQPGYNGIIGCFVAALFFNACFMLLCIRENRARDKLAGQNNTSTGTPADDQDVGDGLPALTDKTDGENPDFRYVY
jgi:hypothetical protein